MCYIPAGSQLWTSSLFLSNTDLFLKIFWRQPVISGDMQMQGFPVMWKTHHENFFVFGRHAWEESWLRSHQRANYPIIFWVTVKKLLVSVCHSIFCSDASTFIWHLSSSLSLCVFLYLSAGWSLHRTLSRGKVWTKLYWGVRLPQQGQMWPWNWTVPVCQRFHW